MNKEFKNYVAHYKKCEIYLCDLLFIILFRSGVKYVTIKYVWYLPKMNYRNKTEQYNIKVF